MHCQPVLKDPKCGRASLSRPEHRRHLMSERPAVGISIVTPWKNCTDRLAGYASATSSADQVIIIDDGSSACESQALREFANSRRNVQYIRIATSVGFAIANNVGLEAAKNDIVMYLNSDVFAYPEWLRAVVGDVREGSLAGPSMLDRSIGGFNTPYLEGWCIAGITHELRRIGGWSEAYEDLYWEDNELSLRALQHKINLVKTNWPIVHMGGYRDEPEWSDERWMAWERNRTQFAKRVRSACNARGGRLWRRNDCGRALAT